MTKKVTTQIKSILEAGAIMFLGLFIFKFIPMTIWGQDIRFDASAHVTISMFILYIIWFFVDQNKTWGIGFFVFSILVLSIVSIQRILVDAHSDIGLLAGFILSCIAILYAQRHRLKGKFRF
jgi:membrane-associated phospholipid phosphatase